MIRRVVARPRVTSDALAPAERSEEAAASRTGYRPLEDDTRGPSSARSDRSARGQPLLMARANGPEHVKRQLQLVKRVAAIVGYLDQGRLGAE
jgi:hypothetical protein